VEGGNNILRRANRKIGARVENDDWVGKTLRVAIQPDRDLFLASYPEIDPHEPQRYTTTTKFVVVLVAMIV